MGNIFIKALDLLSGQRSSRILLLGLDAAGKTSVLYKLKLGESIRTIPTIGFNVERVQYKNIEFTCWDIGGQKKIRGLWRHYYHDVDAIIFVIDSNDPDRIEEAQHELAMLMNQDLLKDAALLVLANKQDLPQSMAPSEIMGKLGLNSCRNREWHVQATVAVSGNGLYEGLDWLSVVLNKKPNQIMNMY